MSGITVVVATHGEHDALVNIDDEWSIDRLIGSLTAQYRFDPSKEYAVITGAAAFSVEGTYYPATVDKTVEDIGVQNGDLLCLIRIPKREAYPTWGRIGGPPIDLTDPAVNPLNRVGPSTSVSNHPVALNDVEGEGDGSNNASPHADQTKSADPPINLNGTDMVMVRLHFPGGETHKVMLPLDAMVESAVKAIVRTFPQHLNNRAVYAMTHGDSSGRPWNPIDQKESFRDAGVENGHSLSLFLCMLPPN